MPASLEVLERVLPGRLCSWARRRPDRVALRFKDFGYWHEVTWRTYRDEVAMTAAALAEAGIGPGDHVAILSDNRPEWLYADLATQALGARAVGIYQTNPAADVAYVLSHSGSKILFCEDQEQVDKAIECREQTPTIETVVVFDPRGTRGYDDPRLVTWEAFRTKASPDADWLEDRIGERDPGEPTMVVYTSGTTGDPKGAMLCSGNVIEPSLSMVPVMGITDRDSVLSYLPLCHVAEKIFSLFLPMVTGAVVHFGESVETVRQDLVEVSPTVFLGVPRIWEKMHASVTLKMKDSTPLKRALYRWSVSVGRAAAQRRLSGKPRPWDRLTRFLADVLVLRALQERLGLRRCRFPISGAAPIAYELLEWFHGIGVPIHEGYGMTECAGISHVNPPGAVRLGTVGTAVPGTEHRTGDGGEVLLKGPHVFCGYLHNEEATASTIDDEGWLHTGDVGRIDAQGYLSITGRIKEIIITAGGKNLSPEKIENALKTSPWIKEAVAVGDGKKFISALIQVDQDAVGDWANRRDLPWTSFEDLSGKPEVEKLVQDEVNRINDAHLARVEQVRAFRLLPKELHQDDGELTATQKVRRRAVNAKFEALIGEIYGS